MKSVQHIEFFDHYHFEKRYHRKKAKHSLSNFIEFFWEIDFDDLWAKHPEGFSDVLFKNIGYTYLINLGTPFIMQLNNEDFEIKSDGFLPRHKTLECHHSPGNKIFGIKFKVSPVIFQKKINFSEYTNYIFPLAYLIEREIVESVKKAGTFTKRMEIISSYYNKIIDQYSGSLKYVDIVTSILKNCFNDNKFDVTIEELSASYGISTRTLQRYFETATGISSKQALQIMRIRKAVEHLVNQPETFDHKQYGYYDYSHFYKHCKQFFGPKYFSRIQKKLNGTLHLQ